ncbi:G kinase-anchoring protein 1 [Amphibalanus amphitrite]|uniref:G kinase-anchoring protein 1 n=1 Tax=Amphibalanus amphitrite TaxID=1232801 RepID=A0A6A4X5W7_AMPAM|nr:G kinase-anchoring protein 1 [Amphibalanus amphitrite]KAF0311500.1 G kinase-anchoring protein 1 [Amphibalanus amphitrite]
MASVMASRFSVLKIEDDSDQEREKAALKKAAEEEKAKKKTNKKKKKSKPAETADAELIDEAFERDLQQAMLMSRVDYEKAATETSPEEAANGHDDSATAAAGVSKARAKKAKAKVFSIDQLQALSNSQGDSRSLQPPPPRPAAAAAAGGDNGDFFGQVERKAKQAATRERILETIRQDLPPSVTAAAAVPAELQVRLATAESQVEELTAELERTKDELRLAKSRTKRVLSVLTQSETKEKVQLIVSLEKAQAARDTADRERADMSAQVTSLLAQLEQERSKVHALTTQLKRAQGNKRRGQSENDAADAVD